MSFSDTHLFKYWQYMSCPDTNLFKYCQLSYPDTKNVDYRSDIECVAHAYRILMKRLEESHCQIRFSAFQVIDELFSRSHAFRTFLVGDFQRFLELTVGK